MWGRKSSAQPAPSENQEVPFVLSELSREWLTEVCELERRCYPSPWSASLIEAEFDKWISYRVGMFEGEGSDAKQGEDKRQRGGLIGYSFNHIIEDELHILNIAVAPELRGQGLGRELLRAVVSEGRARGLRLAILEVRENNKVAQALYQSFGFKFIAVRPSYYRDTRENALVFELKISQINSKP